MKLIKQVSLEFQEGNSDKVYEVDLCEIGQERYVVNFRYGRRGSALREGSKTSAPVSRAEAEQILEKLVASKTKKGYRHAATGDRPTPAPDPVAPVSSDDSPRDRAVLARLAEGHASGSSWPLARAVWRAGELRLHAAEPMLLQLIGSKDAMLDYCIVWALGQCGTQTSVDALRRLEAETDLAGSVRRMAGYALLELLEGAERQRELEQCSAQLPPPLADLARLGPADSLQQALCEHLDDGESASYAAVEILYLIDNEFTRPALLHVLRTAPLAPNAFQPIRHIYKAAEMRRDGEIFGLLAHRFETTRSSFRMPESWHFRYSGGQKPTIGPNAEKAFSSQTRYYLRRRTWRTLEHLGTAGDADYVRMAFGVLKPFTDADATSPRQEYRYDWSNYRTSGMSTTTAHYDRYADYWAFNNILFGNSPRYAPDPGRKFFQCVAPFEPGGPVPHTREEAYPHLWNQYPELLLELLKESRCELVHQFAVKALRGNAGFCRELSIEALLTLLRADYEVTVELGFELAVGRYDATQPDLELVLALANCGFQRAREQAHAWIDDQRTTFLTDADFVVALVAGKFADTRTFARDALRGVLLPEASAQAIIGRLIALLHSLDAEALELASDVAETLLRVFPTQLRRIGADVIRDLLKHPLAEVQQFAGDLVLAHDTLSKQPPADVLQALLDAEYAAVRGIGVRLIGQLPDHALKNNIELLTSLTRNAHADIREAIRPTVARLAQGDLLFGRRFAQLLLEALLVPGAPEGVPSHTSRVLREDLREFLSEISSETVWKLLQSRSAPAQEVGGVLLATNVRSQDLSVEEIVKLSGHEILSVRESAWAMCGENVDRLRSEAEAAIRILDSKWDDTRAFAFPFFRENFKDGVLSPTMLISICDSVRPDVQQFGREMITRNFAAGDGEEYVLKLSEHPTESMQLFASNFLEEHAKDNPERLEQLAPYFVSVLSRVNKGRVAKDRVFRFLEREAHTDEVAARIVSDILTRLSATSAIGDKATAIEIMTGIHDRYPQIALPISVQPLEVRGGV